MALEELVTGLVEEAVESIVQEEAVHTSAMQAGEEQTASYTSNGESLVSINYSYE